MLSRKKQNQIIDERRQQILQAALKVFAKKGFVATKISDIAAEADLSHGLMYHYFKSKDEIFVELVKNANSSSSVLTFEDIAKLEISPLEKIRSIVNMHLSVLSAFQAQGAYLWHINMQASISEAVPATAKEIILKSISESNDYLIPVIIEGQRLGQVIPGDPKKIAGAFYSMIQGMLVLQIMKQDRKDYPIAIPDPDMIMRLFVNPENREAFLAGQIIKKQFGEVKFSNKVLSYRSRESRNQDFENYKVRSMETIEKGHKAFRIESVYDTGRKVNAIIKAENWMPIFIESKNEKGDIISTINYTENSAVFDVPDKDLHQVVKLVGEYYDQNTAYFILQGFPFDTDEKLVTTLVLDDRSSERPIGPYKVEIQKTGRETISVAAGEFDCYKLMMYIVGYKNIYANLWYSAEEPRFLVRLEGTLGNMAELMGIE